MCHLTFTRRVYDLTAILGGDGVTGASTFMAASSQVMSEETSGHFQPCLCTKRGMLSLNCDLFQTLTKWFLCLNQSRAKEQLCHNKKLNIKKCEVHQSVFAEMYNSHIYSAEG